MKKVKLFVMAMALLLVTACGEEKPYTVEELTENNELRNEIIDNYKAMRKEQFMKKQKYEPTEIEEKNFDTASKIERELNS